jgi:hypothetical protein
VDEVTNPTESEVYMTMGYFNNLGSDEDTIYFNATDRYSLSYVNLGRIGFRFVLTAGYIAEMTSKVILMIT